MNRNKNAVGNKSDERNKKRRTSNKKGNSKSSDARRELKDQDMKGAEINKTAWWFDNKELFEQSCQLSMQNIVGAGPVLDAAYPTSFATVLLNPSAGVTPYNDSRVDELTESALNMQSLKLYQQLSMKSGRTASYAPQDISTLMLALGELLSIGEHIRRAFGIACIYNERNWAMPEMVLSHLGFSPSNLFANLASYRMRFNTDITRLNGLPIIANVPYLEKCMELYSHVYTDGTSPMSCLWAYTPATTWLLDESSDPRGTVLQTTPAHIESLTSNAPVIRQMSSWLTLFESMIDKLYNSSSLNVIYADLLNLASQNLINLMKVDYCFETYQVLPMFSDEANLHLRHTTIVGLPLHYEGTDPLSDYNNVFPDPDKNKIIYNPTFEASDVNSDIPKYIINFYDDGNPSLEAKLEATRFTAAPSSIQSAGITWNYVLPDHYAIRMCFYKGRSDAISTSINRSWPRMVSATFEQLVKTQAIMEQLDCHPTLYYYNAEGTNIVEVFADLDFFTTVDRAYLERLDRLTQMEFFRFI